MKIKFKNMLLAILFIYLFSSMMFYKFKHPEKTETQLLQSILKALAWED